MTLLTTEERQDILAALLEKGANKPCSRCGHCTHTLLAACTNHSLFDYAIKLSYGGASIPCVATVCNNCGYLAQYAMGLLGLLKQNKDITNEQSSVDMSAV